MRVEPRHIPRLEAAGEQIHERSRVGVPAAPERILQRCAVHDRGRYHHVLLVSFPAEKVRHEARTLVGHGPGRLHEIRLGHDAARFSVGGLNARYSALELVGMTHHGSEPPHSEVHAAVSRHGWVVGSTATALEVEHRLGELLLQHRHRHATIFDGPLQLDCREKLHLPTKPERLAARGWESQLENLTRPNISVDQGTESSESAVAEALELGLAAVGSVRLRLPLQLLCEPTPLSSL